MHVVRRPLRYPPTWPRERPQEKGVDVALAIDFVHLAVGGAYEVGILFSTDTDLVPALEVVGDLGVHVEVAAWFATRAPNRLTVGASQPWCHFLRDDDYRAVHDPTDYRKSS